MYKKNKKSNHIKLSQDYLEKSMSLTGLLKNNFWPVYKEFVSYAPKYNMFPDLKFYRKLEYKCEVNQEVLKLDLPPSWIGLIAERKSVVEIDDYWEISNMYGEGYSEFINKLYGNYDLCEHSLNFLKFYDKYIEKKKHRAHFVYVITSHNHYGYKIGITNDPTIRAKIIGTELPFKTSIIRLYPFDKDHALITEKFYHELFETKRLNGEWFNLDIDDIDLMDNLFFSSLLPEKQEYIDNLVQMTKTTKIKRISVDNLNSIFRINQSKRHYMTLMNANQYEYEINQMKIEADSFFDEERNCFEDYDRDAIEDICWYNKN